MLPESPLYEMPVLIAATGGTERHSLVLEHALRPMFSYLHAVVSPTGVPRISVAPPADALKPHSADGITKAAADFTRLVRTCGTGCPRDSFAEDVSAMQQLLDAKGD